MGVMAAKGTTTRALVRHLFYQPSQYRSVQDEITFANPQLWTLVHDRRPHLIRGAAICMALRLLISEAAMDELLRWSPQTGITECKNIDGFQ